MASKKRKLELTWIGKGEKPKLEPRILIEQPEYSYGEPDTQNMLIHGDNLLALKALEQEYAGKIKCIYIDPPYNTGSAFEHYDDGVEHSQWLNLITPRLKILKKLLSEDGSIWISIDDNECHYLKVLCDEIFGRSNFIESVVWQKLYTVKNSAKYLSGMHEYLLVYAKQANKFKINLLPRTEKANKGYSNPDNDPRGDWTTNAIQARNYYSLGQYEIISPLGKTFIPPKGTSWRVSQANFEKLKADNRIWWGKKGDAIPRIKKFLNEAKQGMVPPSLWLHTEVGQYAEAKLEVREIFKSVDEIFITPKPEKLLKQVFTLGSRKGDLVLDSFLGSGTTAAVAHKMGRRYIGIELGDHAYSHCYPRLKQVVNGEQGGISKSVKWQGGGGFKFYNLAPSLLRKDSYGNLVIEEQYNADMLAAAMAKQEGFRYQPNDIVYWKQGISTEKDYIYTTTQFITVEVLDRIYERMQTDESLLICCKSFSVECKHRHANITIKKIPQMLIGRCEFGRDDYSFNIIDMPFDREPEEITDESPEASDTIEPNANSTQKTLFD